MDRSSRRGTVAVVFSLLAALCLVAGTGCSRGESEHYTAAHELERRLLMKGGDITYADPGYLNVARELEQVPPFSMDYSRAQEQLKLIKAARRIKANEVYSLDYLPNDLKGVALTSLAPALPDRPEVFQKIHAIPASSQPVSEGAANGSQGAAHDAPTAMGDASQPEAVAKADSGSHYPQVILYGTSWCGYCARARAYFSHRHVPFVDKDVEADPAAAQELLAKVGSYGGVPVIDVGGTIIRGFDVRGIDAALARGSK